MCVTTSTRGHGGAAVPDLLFAQRRHRSPKAGRRWRPMPGSPPERKAQAREVMTAPGARRHSNIRARRIRPEARPTPLEPEPEGGEGFAEIRSGEDHMSLKPAAPWWVLASWGASVAVTGGRGAVSATVFRGARRAGRCHGRSGGYAGGEKDGVSSRNPQDGGRLEAFRFGPGAGTPSAAPARSSRWRDPTAPGGPNPQFVWPSLEARWSSWRTGM